MASVEGFGEAPASGRPQDKVPATAVLEFGLGRLVVDTGRYHYMPAVFIAPVSESGPVGTSAASLEHPLDTLLPGEIVLTFPTAAQAQAVADALAGPATRPLAGEAA